MSTLSFIGSQLLGLSLPAALFSLVFYLIGVKKRDGSSRKAAERATLVTFFLLTATVIVLETAFIGGDYSIRYVYSYSNSTLPLFFKITGLWAGLDGSILLWTWLVSLYSVIIYFQNREKNSDWMPYLNAVMMVILLFFISLMLFANNPFVPLGQSPADGRGLNPLLQNIAMVVHPPCLYLGFTGFSVPFAFVIAALATGRLDSTWIEDSRRWSLVAWSFLTIGLILGGAWAYVELGWGGVWAWDPVENAGLIPWFTATAYLHSVMVQKKRGMLMVWNVSLVILTFMLTIFATYLTRSGVVQSVHAFSESKLGPFFLLFLGVIFVCSFLLVEKRYRDLKHQSKPLVALSKESAFLLNNVILLVSAFAVLWGTLFPTLSEMVTGERITVGEPFFNRIMAPVGLVLLFLMGYGPVISWRQATLAGIKRNLLLPSVIGIAVSVLAIALGLTQWYAFLSSGLIAFAAVTIVMEFYRGIRARQSVAALLIKSNRRYGGYIVHLGILFIFIGITGLVFKAESEFSLKKGETYSFEGFNFVYQQPQMAEDPHKMTISATVDVYRGDTKVDTLYPAKFIYRDTEQPSTEVDIYQTLFEDVYLIIGTISPQTGIADFKVTINPMISFIWIGGVIIILGILVLLLPRSLRIKQKALLVLLTSLMMAGSGEVRAEHEVNPDLPAIESEIADASLRARFNGINDRIICQCGSCVRMSLGSCSCGFARDEKRKIVALLYDEKNDDEIVDFFVKKYGLYVLAQPPREGFFLAGYWIPPVVLILSFTLVLTMLALRRKREGAGASKRPGEPADTYYQKMQKLWEDNQ